MSFLVLFYKIIVFIGLQRDVKNEEKFNLIFTFCNPYNHVISIKYGVLVVGLITN
jgi:hypothetical protein